MSGSYEFLHVDPETGDTCVLCVVGGVAREITAQDMASDMEHHDFLRGLLPTSNPILYTASTPMDAGIEAFVASFEHSFPSYAAERG